MDRVDIKENKYPYFIDFFNNEFFDKMSGYDYNVKVVLVGDDIKGKAYFASRFSKSYFETDYKFTIGVDFHVKTLSVLGKTVKMQLWELLSGERFRSLVPMYYRGALGAIIIFDISKSDFRYELDNTIELIRERAGDIPIVLLTFKHPLEEIQAVSGVEVMLTADNYNGSSLAEISSEPNQNPEIIFSKLAEHIIERCIILPPPRPVVHPRITRNEFIINKYLKLRLEFNKTNIYVGGRLFRQCKYLLLDIPVTNTKDYNEIESIDEAAERLDRSMERGQPRKYHLSPDIEFWGHCSNLQVWYENDYDSRILHRNLAFPLLNALVNVGDPLAKKVFKEEISLRLVSGYPSVVQHLINQGYLQYLNEEELNTLLEDRNFIKNLPKWFNDFKDIPKWLLKRINKKLKDLKCLSCGSKISNVLINNFISGKSIKCDYCYSNII
ncbi:MAG: ADP-ribosylation factor-like protein [Promethearchaeota archaeon]